MGAWDTYINRIKKNGINEKEAILKRQYLTLEKKLKNNLSYQQITIDNIIKNINMITTNKTNEKYIHSLPSQNIKHGDLVKWKDSYWLVTEQDVDNILTTKSKIIKCNYLLKWICKNKVIHEQWCIIEDATKYSTGEYEDKNFIITRGDSRIALTIA